MINAVVWPLPRCAPVSLFYIFCNCCVRATFGSYSNANHSIQFPEKIEKHNHFAFDLTYFPTFRTKSNALVLPQADVHIYNDSPSKLTNSCWWCWKVRAQLATTKLQTQTPWNAWPGTDDFNDNLLPSSKNESPTLAREIPHTTPAEPYCLAG